MKNMIHRKELFRSLVYSGLFLLVFPIILQAQIFTLQPAGERTYRIDFHIQGLRFEKYSSLLQQSSKSINAGVVPYFDGAILDAKVGQPLLPQTGFTLILPGQAKPLIKILSEQHEIIPGVEVPVYRDSSTVRLLPQAMPVDSALVTYGSVQVFAEIPLHSFQLRPFRYDSAAKTLTVFTRLSLLIETGEPLPPVIFRAARQTPVSQLSQIALNAAQVVFKPKPPAAFLAKPQQSNWYDPNRSYLKIFVAEDGIYHLRQTELAQAGISVDEIDPKTFEMFYAGEPYPIFVSREASGSFTADDYIEFYGQRQPGVGQYYNDYSDTSVYWLTWGAQPGLRVTTRNVTPRTATFVNNFYFSEHCEEDKIYYSGDNSLAIFNTDPTPGEGWIWQRIYAGDVYYYNVTTNNYTSSVWADSLTIKVRGITDDEAAPDHHIEVLVNNQSIADFVFDGVRDFTFRTPIPAGIIKEGLNTVTLRSLQDTGAQYDAIYLDWFELSYNRRYVASDNRLQFSFPDSLSWRAVLYNITNLHQDSVVVYDVTHCNRLAGFQIHPYSDRYFIAMTDSVVVGTWYLVNTAAAIKSVARMVLDRPSDWHNPSQQADYVIITHRRFWQQAYELAQWRQQTSGVHPVVVDIEDILDEFNYGLMDPLAMRSFLRYAVQNWQAPTPKFVLLFGDASWDYKKHSENSVKDNWLPAYGNPVSDSRLVSLDGDSDFLPDLFVGRLPVETAEEAAMVIEKIKSYQNVSFSNWQKNVIFLNGGVDDWEQDLFQQQSEETITNQVLPAPFGGNPVRIYKQSEGRLLGELRGEIMSAIDRGALWLSFLGHAGSETWDLMLINEDILQLNNGDKNPFITSMTCHTARFATPSLTSFGELFVKVPGRGAIAFWGTSGWGYIYQDQVLINQLFKLLLRDQVTTLGEATTLTKLYLWSLLGYSQMNISSIDQYTLLGDPLQRLAMPTKPDLAVQNQQITILPEEPTEDDSLLQVKLQFNNYGLVPADSIVVEFSLRQGDSDSIIVPTRLTIPPPGYTTETSLALPLSDLVGDVQLLVQLDPDNRLEELYEDNNQAEKSFYIYSTSITLAKPSLYAVVHEPRPVLQVYSPEASAATTRLFYFELDTTSRFDSSFLQQSGGLPEQKIVTRWQPHAPLPPAVYFWRCRMQNPDPSGHDVSQFSRWLLGNFRVDLTSDSVAWRQDAKSGVPAVGMNQLSWQDSALTLAKSTDNFVHLEVQSAGHDDGNRCYLIVNYAVVNQGSRGHNIVALDATNGKIIAGPRAFDTYADSSSADSLADFINAQPANTIFLIGIRDEGSFRMTEKAYLALESLGSQHCREVDFRDSWALIGWKEAPPNAVPESLTRLASGVAFVRDTLRIFYAAAGWLNSGEIGPATDWQRLNWRLDLTVLDSHFRLRVSGWNQNSRNWEVVSEAIQGESFSLSHLSAQQYPRLNLQMELSDADALHTPRFYAWEMDYTPPPDLTTHPDLFSLVQDSVLEGMPAAIRLPVYNVGMTNADSVQVRLELQNEQSGWDSVAAAILPIVAKDDSVWLRLDFSTAGKPGERHFRITLDPGNLLNELSETNNQYGGKLFVRSDSVRPQIEITFDDRPILFGELVSCTPVVRIDVRDNSPLAIADTGLVQLSLDSQPVYFSSHDYPQSPLLEFQPLPSGGSTGSGATVLFRPQLQSGQHVLEVIAWDATRNPTYARVDFLVESEFTLRDVMNVPNPFIFETHFTYFLTQSAERVTLAVFTIAGRTILKVENLPGVVGFNSFSWNGEDADGDPIANGVYLYQIKAMANGKTVSVLSKLVVMK